MRTRVSEQTLCKNNACVSVWTCRCVFVCTAMQGLKVSIKAAAAPGCCHTHPCWPVQYLRDPHSQNVGIGCKLLGEHGLHGFLIQFQLQLFIQIEVIQCPERPRLLLQSRTFSTCLSSMCLHWAVQSSYTKNTTLLWSIYCVLMILKIECHKTG